MKPKEGRTRLDQASGKHPENEVALLVPIAGQREQRAPECITGRFPPFYLYLVVRFRACVGDGKFLHFSPRQNGR